MISKGKIREVREEDINSIYELCKRVELRNNPKAMAENGFLLAAYSRHPEEKETFKDSINHSLFFLYEENKDILGFILGYSYWDDPYIYSDIIWDTKKLEKMGIKDINELLSKNNIAYLYQVAVDPDFRKRKTFRLLADYFFRNLKEVDYVFTEIIEEAYNGDVKNPLKIKNNASISAFQKIGAAKVGYAKPCYLPKTFLGEKGLFSYGVYLINLKEYFKTF